MIPQQCKHGQVKMWCDTCHPELTKQPPTVMSDKKNIELLAEQAGKALNALLLETPEAVAIDVRNKVFAYMDALKAGIIELEQKDQSHAAELDRVMEYVQHKEDCYLNLDFCNDCGNFEDEHCAPDGSCPPTKNEFIRECTCGLSELLITNTQTKEDNG